MTKISLTTGRCLNDRLKEHNYNTTKVVSGHLDIHFRDSRCALQFGSTSTMSNSTDRLLKPNRSMNPVSACHLLCSHYKTSFARAVEVRHHVIFCRIFCISFCLFMYGQYLFCATID
uniref:Tick transposon n=1 Tax=Rhipicephalus appendiculatus TaxID=34631 RepID=A0A131YEM3_RHIAP